jgi:hypothetical protein
VKSIVSQKIKDRFQLFLIPTLFLTVVLAFQIPVGAANTFPHIYELVSVNNVDGQGVNQNATFGGNHQDSVTYDGSKVLFMTDATDLPDAVAGTTSGYVRDMNAGTTIRVNKSQSGVLADGITDTYTMSETGRYIALGQAQRI